VADVVALRRSDRPPQATPTGKVGLAGLAAQGLVRPASAPADPTEVAYLLPVVADLARVLPWGGLRRGSTVAVAAGPGATSLLYALLADATTRGAWCAVVGRPELGLVAAAEAGVALSRLALVPSPGPDWVSVVAALLDGVDIVVAATPGPVTAATCGRLAARARQRGSVLMPFGQWAGADLTLTVDGGRWHGLGTGQGRLRQCDLTVVAAGRGGAHRPRRATLHLGTPTPRTLTPTALPARTAQPAPAAAPAPVALPAPAAAPALPAPTALPAPAAAAGEAAGLRLVRAGEVA
jgi:hypothetical protein